MRRGWAWLLALVAGGCAFGGDPPDVHEYDLLARGEPIVATPQALAAPPVALQIVAFEADPVLDRDGLVWRRGEVEVGAYALHRWARRPQDGLRDVLAEALRDALPGATVASDPPLAEPELLLHGHLARCEEVEQGERWAGALELRVALVDRDGVELLRRTYAVEEPATMRNPPGVVAALRRAALRVARLLADDVARALGGTSPTK